MRIASLLCSLLLAGTADAADITARKFLNYVKQLSSAQFKGRGTGTAGLEEAARYIAAEFERAGLRPANGKSYLQPFPVSIESSLGSKSSLVYTLAGEKTSAGINEEFIPLSFSGSGEVEGEVVFAGYGISALEYGYDDYAGIDARGKIVVLLRHEPQEFDGSSRFEGRIYTEHSQLFSKALNARQHGARAVLYVDDTANHSTETLEKFVSLVGPADPGMPFVQVKSSVVEKWFAHAGRNFKTAQEAIDKELQPQSFAFGPELRAALSVDVAHKSRDVYNVSAYLPGKTQEYIVVGAHYDHLGLGEQYSLAADKVGQPHPGADDNASGTAGVLSLARQLASQPKLKRGVLFIAFAGEELGLLGSSHYVNHPILPLEQAVLMINMDMIGRIRENKVLVGGVNGQSATRSLLERLDQKSTLELQLDDQGVYGSSDHTSFQAKSIPIWFFFSGLHPDYHKPSDTWQKINAKDAARLLNLIVSAVLEVSGSPPRLQLAAPARTFSHESSSGGR